MNTKQKLITRLENEIRQRWEKIEIINKLPGLEALELDAYYFNNESIDFDHLTHADTIKVIKELGGEWDKTPSDGGTINYSAKINGINFRCYNGEPPPNCKIVEVIETIPAEPARIVTRKKLVCQ